MNYDKCEKCKEYHWSNQDCKPEYLVYYEDYLGDEPKAVRGDDHEEAALKFAEYYNSNGDYNLMNNTIKVKVEKDGIIKYFEVGAEPDIHYTSKEIESI